MFGQAYASDLRARQKSAAIYHKETPRRFFMATLQCSRPASCFQPLSSCLSSTRPPGRRSLVRQSNRSFQNRIDGLHVPAPNHRLAALSLLRGRPPPYSSLTIGFDLQDRPCRDWGSDEIDEYMNTTLHGQWNQHVTERAGFACRAIGFELWNSRFRPFGDNWR